jgi:DNA-binding response OmpR family regulator
MGSAEPIGMSEQPRVLLVEDEWLIAFDMSERLQEFGYRVIGPAADVETALRLIRSERIDLALLDLHLGTQRSYPVGEALRENGIPFAFLTGHARADLRADFREQVMLCKPVSDRELVARLGLMLRPA